MATQFGQRFDQTDIGKPGRDARPQLGRSGGLFVDGATQNLTNFFFHAPAVLLCAAFEHRFHIIFKVANNDLCYGYLRLLNSH